jgi:hypothetical protein
MDWNSYWDGSSSRRLNILGQWNKGSLGINESIISSFKTLIVFFLYSYIVSKFLGPCMQKLEANESWIWKLTPIMVVPN